MKVLRAVRRGGALNLLPMTWIWNDDLEFLYCVRTKSLRTNTAPQRDNKSQKEDCKDVKSKWGTWQKQTNKKRVPDAEFLGARGSLVSVPLASLHSFTSLAGFADF